MDAYHLWATDPYFDEETRRELVQLTPGEIEDRFGQMLAFGTGGLRGLLGAGTNRVNRYIIRLAAFGVAQCVSASGPEAPRRGVVIAHDCRHGSALFARETALTLAAAGVTAYLWDELRPTPMLSYAVRHLNAAAGVVITASHNPKEYNGFKVYGEDGGQLTPDRAQFIHNQMSAARLTDIRPLQADEALAKGLLRAVPPEVDRAYFDRLGGLLRAGQGSRSEVQVLYTPLHGAGTDPVRLALSEAGFRVEVLAEQAAPDPDFSTVPLPNPEDPAVFALALRRAADTEPDLILATDPDADRLGVMVRDRGGAYIALSGNQLGALLTEHMLRTARAEGHLPSVGGTVVKTIATSNLVMPICQEYGVDVVETHVGFKYIADQIREYEETGSRTFLFGFEESHGYLGAPFVRDKDAVMASVLAAEAALAAKAAGRTLWQALEALWQRHGYYAEEQHNAFFAGTRGQQQMADMLARLRQNPPADLGGLPIALAEDYRTGLGLDRRTGQTYSLSLDRADVIRYRFDDGGFVLVRPSGTEPKLKVYFSVRCATRAEAEARLRSVKADTRQLIG